MDQVVLPEIRVLVDNVVELLINAKNNNTSIIKINSEHLLVNGELSFPINLQAWNSLISKNNLDFANILEYFLHSSKNSPEITSDSGLSEKAFRLLISVSNTWVLKIQKCALRRDRVCVFLNRPYTFSVVIKNIIHHGANYGKRKAVDKSFYFKVQPDEESELTTQRLLFIKNVSENILRAQGYKILDNHDTRRYVLTIKSQGDIEENYSRNVCGVVKSSETNVKETTLTWKIYWESKTSQLLKSAEHKYSCTEDQGGGENSLLNNIAKAAITFELLAIKPSRTVSINSSSNSGISDANTKGASFVLYNTARIATILEKYLKEESIGNYPKLMDIDKVNFSLLIEEEEWELLYNFLLGYPEMIRTSIKHEHKLELCLQNVCLFACRLCQKFSVYYRRTRILTEGRDHLIPVMTARLYLLKALRVILHSVLAILDIDPVGRL